jgi:alpha-beta hydrolase superfamily lysophospholipase
VAGDDKLVNTRSSTQFFESLDLEDKTLHIYENGYHEIYNEVENLQTEVFKDLENWVEKQIESSSGKGKLNND